jgi:hypothetical protein
VKLDRELSVGLKSLIEVLVPLPFLTLFAHNRHGDSVDEFYDDGELWNPVIDDSTFHKASQWPGASCHSGMG